jgi:hypothetical protein
MFTDISGDRGHWRARRLLAFRAIETHCVMVLLMARSSEAGRSCALSRASGISRCWDRTATATGPPGEYIRYGREVIGRFEGSTAHDETVVPGSIGRVRRLAGHNDLWVWFWILLGSRGSGYDGKP